MGIISGGGFHDDDGSGVRGWLRWIVRSVFNPAQGGTQPRKVQLLTWGVLVIALVAVIALRVF